MSNFQARTRLRGEVSYYKANWQDNHDGYHSVLFIDGPHKGETHSAKNCAIAQDDKYLLGGREKS